MEFGFKWVELDLVPVEYIEKKLRRGNVESTSEEGFENHDLVVELARWEFLTRCRPLVNQIMMRCYPFNFKLLYP